MEEFTITIKAKVVAPNKIEMNFGVENDTSNRNVFNALNGALEGFKVAVEDAIKARQKSNPDFSLNEARELKFSQL